MKKKTFSAPQKVCFTNKEEKKTKNKTRTKGQTSLTKHIFTHHKVVYTFMEGTIYNS
jgi:hypothetical protein